MMQSEERFTAVQDNATLRTEVKDLTEKLETLKGWLSDSSVSWPANEDLCVSSLAKRAADVDKLRELDRLRLEVETLNEFRTKVLESQAALHKELKKVASYFTLSFLF